MNQELKLQIGGIGISIKWHGSKIISWLYPHYQDFIYEGRTEVNLRVHCGNLPPYPQDELIFDGEEEGYWKIYRNSSEYVVETYDTLTHKKNKVCFMEPDFSSGDVYIDPESERSRRPRIKKGPFFSLPSLMRPLAEILLVNLLNKNKGIMVHGLGISEKGKGIAFLGATGTGKSTLAEFYKNEKGVNILSDEHIIVRKKNGQFWLYGTPWPGMAMAASSESIPLNHILFIEHASENKILDQGTLSDLFPLLFLPFWDRESMEIILKFCEELLGKIKCNKLGFIKNRSVIDFVREVKKYEEGIHKTSHR